jgi:photosystem II stability/assembly factor-like uncharacterized protein
MTIMKITKAALAIVLLMFACNDDDDKKSSGARWKKLGLDGKTVNEIKISGSMLYVATTSGLYKMDGSWEEDDFELIGFEHKNVEAVEIMSGGKILASLFDKTGAEPPTLFQTTDDGASWGEVNSDFGGAAREPIFDLELHPHNQNVLYATGFSVIASSVDGGNHWEPSFGDWGGFATGLSVIEINPKDNRLWAGGQGAIENGFLVSSSDGNEWESWNDLVENPTVVKEITFSDVDQNEIFVGWEGALLRTDDGGATWETLIDSEETRFFFGVCLRPGESEKVYTAGWIKTPNPQPLVLFSSEDAGMSWEEIRYADEQYGGVLDMQIKQENGKDVLVLGLDKGGVYEVTITD